MKKEEIKVTKYIFDRNSQKYFLYLVPNGDMVEFILNRDGYSEYECVVDLLSNDSEKFEEVIEGNIDIWIEDYSVNINE